MSHKVIRTHFKSADPVIFKAMADVDFFAWIKPQASSTTSYFGALTREIIGQQLSGAAAGTITNRFIDLLPSGLLKPESVLALDDQAMRDAGMSWAKVRYVKNIALAFKDKQINASKLHQWTDEEVITHLTRIKGVGRWTAEMFLIFTLGREDVFSHGDLGLRRGLEKLYQLTNPTKGIIENIVTKWSPYKSYGSIALWHNLDSATKGND